MTASPALWRAAPQIFAGQYRRLRSAHPVLALRWLQNSVLLGTAAAALLYVWVAVQADHDIDASRRTSQAIADIGKASRAASDAGKALHTAFTGKDVTLIGTGSDYVNEITQVDKYLTLAAEDNAAGTEGTSEIQFVSGQLQTYLQLSENAVRDYGGGKTFGLAAESYASGGDGDLQSALADLKATEQRALSAQRGSWPLDPWAFWLALLGPVIAVLLLVVATTQLLARHFRRHVSPWLWGSLLTSATVEVTAGFFNWSDERHLSASRWASNPATVSIALVLFAGAGVLAYLAYRPRLAEYRFRPS